MFQSNIEIVKIWKGASRDELPRSKAEIVVEIFGPSGEMDFFRGGPAILSK
jgi:hypothetical protein